MTLSTPTLPSRLATLVAAWLLIAPSAEAAPPPAEPKLPDAVELDWATYQLLAADELAPEPEADPPYVARRTVRITPRPDGDPPGVDLHVTWRIAAPRAGFLAGPLAGPEVEVERAMLGGKPAPVVRSPEGSMLVVWVEADTVLELDAFVPAGVTEDGADLRLHLLPAVIGEVEVDHPVLFAEPLPGPEGDAAPAAGDGPVDGPVPVGSTAESDAIVRTDGKTWSGAETLGIRLRGPKPPDKATGPIAVAHVGLGITVGEGELRSHARVVWTLRRGSVDHLAVKVTGLGDDLEVEGRDVKSFSREGERILLQLAGPVSTRAEVRLRWSQPLTEATETTIAVPRIEPEGAFRSDASLQLARDGEIEVVPDVGSWTAIPAADLPMFGQGLVEGTPTAAYERGRTGGEVGSLSLLRFVPVPGPAAVVDVAAYTIATTEDGRTIALAKYQVRNERAAFLRITPPEGVTIIGARIAGETAIAGREHDTGTWLIPLKRSLETVEGLLTFPVEVTLLGDSAAWSRRERRQLTLPTVDAPVAVSRVTVYLPPEYRSRLEPGDGAVVGDFTEGEGITYGLSLDEEQTAEADQTLQAAVEDYRRGDFQAAQHKLDELGQIGAVNENIDRLQANVDLVTGKGDSGGDEALNRRVKEQARARASEEFEEKQRLEEQAVSLAREGQFEKAEEAYQQAIDIGEKLGHLEQEESVEIAARQVQLEDSLGKVREDRKRKAEPISSRSNRETFRAQIASKAGKRRGRRRDRNDAGAFAAGGEADEESETVYDFDSEDFDAEDQYILEGHNMTPDGASVASRSEPPPVQPSSGEVQRVEVVEADKPPPPVADRDRWGGEPPPDSGRWSRGEPTAAPEAEPAPVPMPVDEDEMLNVPVVTATGTDRVTAVADRSRFGGRLRRDRRSGRSLGGISRGVAFKKSANKRSRRGRTRARGVAPGAARAEAAPQEPLPPPAPAPETTTTTATTMPADAPAAGPAPAEDFALIDESKIERLPAPEVTASAVSVVIPAIGEAVLYQTLLIEAGQTQTIPIDARRRRRRREPTQPGDPSPCPSSASSHWPSWPPPVSRRPPAPTIPNAS